MVPVPHAAMFIILVWTQHGAMLGGWWWLWWCWAVMRDNIEVILVLFLVRPAATPDQHVGNV